MFVEASYDIVVDIVCHDLDFQVKTDLGAFIIDCRLVDDFASIYGGFFRGPKVDFAGLEDCALLAYRDKSTDLVVRDFLACEILLIGLGLGVFHFGG